jgi:hypothetical protein
VDRRSWDPCAHRCGRRSRRGGRRAGPARSAPERHVVAEPEKTAVVEILPPIRAVAVYLTAAFEGAVVVAEPRRGDLADGRRGIDQHQTVRGNSQVNRAVCSYKPNDPIPIAVVSNFRCCCPRRRRAPRNHEHHQYPDAESQPQCSSPRCVRTQDEPDLCRLQVVVRRTTSRALAVPSRTRPPKPSPARVRLRPLDAAGGGTGGMPRAPRRAAGPEAGSRRGSRGWTRRCWCPRRVRL